MLEKILMEVYQIMSESLDKEQLDSLKNVLFIKFHDKKIIEETYEIIPSEIDEDTRLIKLFRASKKISGRSDNTLSQYIPELMRCRQAIGKSFKDITTMDLRWYFGVLQEQRGNKMTTILNKKRCLNSFYSFLLNEGLVSSNPVSRIETFKIEQTIKRAFSIEEMQAIRESCSHIRDRALIEFLYSTGLRVSELVSLNIGDIDMANKEFSVIGKGSKERIAYFSSTARFYLNEYLKWRMQHEKISESELKSKPLFAGIRKPYKRFSKEGIEALLRNMGKNALVDNVHPHRFRRTFATNMAARGMKIEEIAKLMGHAKLETTLIYCNVSQDNIKSSYTKFTA